LIGSEKIWKGEKMPCSECGENIESGDHIHIEKTGQYFCSKDCVAEYYDEVLDVCMDIIPEKYGYDFEELAREKICPDCEDRIGEPDDGGWRD
jgi:hypothetical protein